MLNKVISLIHININFATIFRGKFVFLQKYIYDFRKFIFFIFRFFVFLCLLIVIPLFFVESYRVEGDSMSPSFNDGDVLLINKFDKSYNRGDFIIFNKNGSTYIKRVVGLPGEYVSFDYGSIVIDGVSLAGYSYSDVFYKPRFRGHISKNSYFVLGDNINNSVDSRTFGYVNSSDIEGIVFLKYLPVTNLSFY